MAGRKGQTGTMKFETRDIGNAMFASLIGTIVLSVIMVMKQNAGIAPQLNPIADLAGVAHSLLGIPNVSLVGWLLHFAVGTFVWGPLFGVIHLALPGSNLGKGLIFGIGAWLLMMGIFSPIAGHGLFGMNVGMVVPLMTLMLHLVYGAVLGVAFGKFSPE